MPALLFHPLQLVDGFASSGCGGAASFTFRRLLPQGRRRPSTGFDLLFLLHSCRSLIELMGPRWKGKGFADIAKANPMSQIVDQLQSSLSQSGAHTMLSCCTILLEADPDLAELLSRTCFGQPISTSEKEKDSCWFELGMEEAFYLSHALHCLKVLGGDGNLMSKADMWECMRAKSKGFPKLYKGYAHLRARNWVVRSGIQYGVDFVAYRHHPALVHSEYAVLVVEDGDGDGDRLRVWSDLQGSLRVCGSVAKRLLLLSIGGGEGCASSSECLARYTVEERTVARWVPEQCREDHVLDEGQAN